MRIKERWKIDRIVRSAKKRGTYTLCINLHIAMSDIEKCPGTPRWLFAAVYCIDGEAIIVPSTLRCGIIVREWSSVMRYIRKHNL